MKNKNEIGSVLLAMTVALGAAQNVAADAVGKEQELALREIAYTATLAKFVSTNSQAFVAALAPSVRGRWLKDEPKLRVRDVQILLPDFFKVAYVYNGGIVDDAFCFGLYNPFYDHMLLCKAKGVKRSEIVDYKWVSGSVLRGDAETPKYPLASGVNPPDQYFPTMLRTMGNVIKSFNSKFVGPSPDASFAALQGLDEAGFARFIDIAVFRSSQAVKMAGDKSAFGLATLANLIFSDERFVNQPFLGGDVMTKAVVETISKMPGDFRKAFRPIGFFEVKGEKCILFYNATLPSFLALARSADGKVIRLGMFDVHIADGWEKRVDFGMGNAK